MDIASGRIKNHGGKIISKTNREKLPRVRSVTTSLIPVVKRLAIVEFGRSDPKVVFGAVTKPTHEKLVAATMFS